MTTLTVRRKRPLRVLTFACTPFPSSSLHDLQHARRISSSFKARATKRSSRRLLQPLQVGRDRFIAKHRQRGIERHRRLLLRAEAADRDGVLGRLLLADDEERLDAVDHALDGDRGIAQEQGTAGALYHVYRTPKSP